MPDELGGPTKITEPFVTGHGRGNRPGAEKWSFRIQRAVKETQMALISCSGSLLVGCCANAAASASLNGHNTHLDQRGRRKEKLRWTGSILIG